MTETEDERTREDVKREERETRESCEKERASVGGVGFAQRPWLLSSSSSSSSLLHTLSLLLLLNLILTLFTSLPLHPVTQFSFISPNQ